MKNKKLIFKLLFLIFASLIVLYPGCGEDTINNNGGTGSGGWHPNLTFLVGQNIVYTNDSITPSGATIRTRRGTNMTINAQTTIGGQLCYPFIGSTRDTATNQTTPEAYYFRYDQTEGKYYQYGIRKLINPTQPDSWDLVGDFDLARGTSYLVGNINYTITIPGVGTVTFNGPLNGKIADSTTITSTGTPPQSISCYRIEMTASISGTSPLGQVSANIIMDYYLGYSTPTGIVEIKIRPFSFTVAGIPGVAPQPGYDRKIYRHTP